jgi:hypothetical protein
VRVLAAKLCLALVSTTFLASNAVADLVAHWNFNSLTNSTNNGTTYAPSSGAGSLTLTCWTTTGTTGITAFAGTTVNAVGADTAGQALALQGGTTSGTPNNGAQSVFSFNLSSFTDPILSFATQKTTTGFSSNQVAYSTDGVIYTDFGSAYNPATSFATQTVDLSSVAALDLAPTAFIRITFSGATSNSGNNRIDNIQLNATAVAVPEASSLFFGGLICSALGLTIGYRKLRARAAA